LINLIWDIDGTLLNTKGLGATPFCEAFTDHTGKPAVIDKKKLSGFTDFEIALSLMRDAGIKEDIYLAENILNSFSVKLEGILANNPPELLGDVQHTLEFTETSSDFVNSIGTGNFRAGAIVKLKSAGIYKYFKDSKFHVATSDLWDRDAIINSAADAGQGYLNLVIGDSPRDISSARFSNLPVLAVASGQHSVEELTNLKPDFILESKWSLDEFIRVIDQFRGTQI
jgi:phosphoglycolate phosphatase-like HAD superfamily hydrolase